MRPISKDITKHYHIPLTAVLAAYFNYFIMVERFYQLTIYRLSEKTCTFAHVIWVLMQKQR